VSYSTVAEEYSEITVAELFDLVNAQRKLLRKTPVEDRAMSSRCTLRFSIVSGRELDFNVEKILILPDEIAILEKMLNDQFGIYFDGEVQKLVDKYKNKIAAKTKKAETFISTKYQAQSIEEGNRLVSALKRLFGR